MRSKVYRNHVPRVCIIGTSDFCILISLSHSVFPVGQCNDAFFKLSKEGKVTMLVDSATSFTPHGLELKSGKTINADVVVLALGCKYTEQPTFLQTLKTGN